MKLTDRELLDLHELCGALIDGRSTAEQRTRLAEILRRSEAARRYYARAMDQSASLHSYAAEMLADAPERVSPPTSWRWRAPAAWWWPAGALLAVAAALGFFIFRPGQAPVAADAQVEFVARVTGEKAARWVKNSEGLACGAHLRRGQRLELGEGFAEVTFDSGARLVLEGAASLDVNSAWGATLRRGALKASVPPQAIGFHVANPAVDVIDLGTEFTMIADGSGAAEVLVLKGEVEATPRGASEVETILLRENEARRFASSGVSDVSDRGRKFAHFAQPLAFDRFSAAIRYLHWSFDEPQGDVAAAESFGGNFAAAEASLKIAPSGGTGPARIAGRFDRALVFNGQTEARGAYPGLSSDRPRTLAFWVRVAEDAPLSDAYSMIAWATHLPKLGARPVQISWNRRPAEGPIGALRTDFGGGYAMSTTSLRDGRWHHVAVYFFAGEDPSLPVQVTQYVDGRLESSTIVQTKMSAQPGRGDAAIADVLWVGCRLTSQMRREHFRGEIDELFIADRALEPDEIVSLMKTNRIGSPVALR